MDKIINNTTNYINILITDKFLELNIDNNLGFENDTSDLEFKNKTEIIKLLIEDDLRFGLKTYDKYISVYTIVLNFMFETGGVF